ncbi:MAG: efflux RND transporter permease subunit [Ketobacteraceae bacterium]|nr:efflux RND transporter permease subunit [Ketobacteraceae bacterium]
MLNYYTTLMEKHYKLIFALSLLLVFCTFAKLGQLGLSNDMRVYFSKDNPHRASLDLLEDTFGKQDSLIIYIATEEGTVFNRNTLALIEELTDTLWQTPYSRRVDSLTNFQRTQADEDELTVNFLVENATKLDDAQLADIKSFATADPQLSNRLVSEDGKATAINISFSFPSADPSSMEDIPTLAAKEARSFVREVVEKVREKHPELTVLIGGVVAANLTMADAVEDDLGTLLPLSYLFIFIVIYIFTRSWKAVWLTLSVITLSIMAAMGLFAFTGRPLTPTIGFVPTAIMAIAVADCVHFLVGYINNINANVPHKQAVIQSLKTNTSPIVITSLTTVVGLLGLNFSEAEPYRDMGNIMATGVAIALFLTLTFLPGLLMMLPKIRTKGQIAGTRWMDGLAEFVIKRPKVLTAVILVVIVIGGAGFFKNEVSERWYLYFGESFEVRQSADAIDENLSGIHSFHYTLNTGEENGIYDPVFWQEVDAFSDWFRSQPGVAHVDSMADIMKSINQNMSGGLDSEYTLPESRELTAQYILVYQFSLPQGLGLETYVNTDNSAIRLTASIHKSDSNDMIALDRRAREWLEQNATRIEPIHGTGMDLMFSRIAAKNANSLLHGTLIVLVLVSVILLFVLKSLKLGIISLVPNVAPAVLAYGLWGYFHGVIDLSSTVVICIALGIVVDDTVHFLSKYRIARTSLGKNTEDAIRYAFHSVGSALVITTLALVAGFLITVMSSFEPSANLGILLSLTLTTALIIDLLLLPALLLLFDKRDH